MQGEPYRYTIRLDRFALQDVVNHFMREVRHLHNFEVWRDEVIIRVNEIGKDCIVDFLEKKMPGAGQIIDDRLIEAGIMTEGGKGTHARQPERLEGSVMGTGHEALDDGA